jgi:hypothetical protein
MSIVHRRTVLVGATVALVLLAVGLHLAGVWGWYGAPGSLNGGVWVGSVGLEVWGHPGFFTGQG